MNDMNITRVTIGDEYPVDIVVGENNVKRIEYYLESVRVIYNDASFLIYPMRRVYSVGGFMRRDDIWDADPRANDKPGKFGGPTISGL